MGAAGPCNPGNLLLDPWFYIFLPLCLVVNREGSDYLKRCVVCPQPERGRRRLTTRRVINEKNRQSTTIPPKRSSMAHLSFGVRYVSWEHPQLLSVPGKLKCFKDCYYNTGKAKMAAMAIPTIVTLSLLHL